MLMERTSKQRRLRRYNQPKNSLKILQNNSNSKKDKAEKSISSNLSMSKQSLRT
jgi:hypothetical protein